ncbi:MAG TPA: hypothetical protein DHN33_11690, partial [Eubacteriaceae bacterium]|nr:hypothetical protein [Eubacteriaceae bacterium]
LFVLLLTSVAGCQGSDDIEKINVSRYPDSVVEGTTLKPSDIKVEIVFESEQTEVLSPDQYRLSNYRENEIGIQNVEVQYQDFRETFSVEVREKQPVEAEVVSPPDSEYLVLGEEYDLSGLTLRITYDNEETEIVEGSQLTLTDYEEKTGRQEFGVLYDGIKAHFNWEIVQRASAPSNKEAIIVNDPDAIDVLVTKERALPADYEPNDLKQIEISLVYEGNTDRNKMRAEAADALKKMSRDAKENNLDIRSISAYRSFNTQHQIFNRSVENNGIEHASRYSARPGHSEHQTGLVSDVTTPAVVYGLVESFGDTPEGRWIAENVHRYGFIVRYPEGKEDITGYAYEPWHLRYLGVDLASEVYESGLTYDEFYKKYKTAE